MPRKGIAHLLVSEVVEKWPTTARVFARVGMGACPGCAMSGFETVQEAIRIMKADTRQVLRELKRAIEQEG